jgi:hypothetical protein
MSRACNYFRLNCFSRPIEGEDTVSIHRSSIMHRACAVLVAATLLGMGVTTGSARIWKPSPEKVARDYATINDVRPTGDLVLLMWFVPGMIQPDAAGAAAVKAILQKYVVLVAAHGTLDKTTVSYSFEDIDHLQATDQNQQPLAPISRNDLPPATIAVLSALEAMFRQTAGAMGKGMKVFVFDAGAVNSCTHGELTVPLAGETYTWETPIPACPAPDQK